MIWVSLILVFSTYSAESFSFFGDDFGSWGLPRTPRETIINHADRVKSLFPSTPDMVCNMLYKTKEAPSTAIVLYRTSGRLICMGSIVDTRHILTAKKCYEKADVSDVLVLVGYYKAYWGENSQVRRVEKIIRHDYAIALLRLKDPIKYTQYVKPTKLPSSGSKVQQFELAWPPPYNVLGYQVDRFEVPGEFVDKSKTYAMKDDFLVPTDTCAKLNYTGSEVEIDKVFCTKGNATYCWGGWGGAVFKKMEDNHHLQIGVVFQDNCTATMTGPFLAARTDVFGDWIRANTWQGHQPS